MHHRFSRLTAAAAGLTVVAGLVSTAAAAAPPALAAPARTTSATAGATSAGLFLINGDQARKASNSKLSFCLTTIDFAVTGGPASQVQTMSVEGHTYAIPDEALPYLGRGLAPSLFDVSSLAQAESGGTLPLQLSYTGSLPALPGVTITRSGGGTAAGYLTAAGARTFGAALLRQFAADHSRGSYGQDGIFSDGLSLSLAGVPADPARSAGTAQPEYPMHTLTVTATNRAGKPDTGDSVMVFNADDVGKFDDPLETSNYFYNGVTKFSLPAGHYWGVGEFYTLYPKEQTFDVRLVMLSGFTVTTTATVHVSETAATSKMQMVTPRPGNVVQLGYNLLRTSATGGTVGLDWANLGGFGSQTPGIFLSPTTQPPAIGTLTSISTAQLNSPSGAKGTPYSYNLAYSSSGVIPAQRFVVRPASLATVRARFYSGAPSTGYLGAEPIYPVEVRTCGYGGGLFAVQLPSQQTYYFNSGHSLGWQITYNQTQKGFGSGGQTSALQDYLPGEHLTENFGGYPLHPAADERVNSLPTFSSVPGATRAGNTLGLLWTAFSDNQPGDVGNFTAPPYKASASYQLDQNGTKIAGGAVGGFGGTFGGKFTLSSNPATMKFTLATKGSSALYPLSAADQSVWTWHTARESGSTLPAGWTCGLAAAALSRACAVQPLLTVRYNVVGMNLSGATAPGQQVVRLSVGHLQLAQADPVTHASVQASFDGGKTWHPATITGSGGGYAAVFTAPAGADVTLRTSVSDAGGGSYTDTITDAYQVATATAATTTAAATTMAATAGAVTSGPMRAACPAIRPGQAQCYALYAPQTAVNAAIAARAAGRAVSPAAATPQGWGAKDIEAAYKLPLTGGSGQTVALVDAFSTPHLASDLAVYRKQYGLPACTTASGCLRIVNQNGNASPLPQPDPFGWGVEETLDVSMVSAACPLCKIVVVEAKTPSFKNLGLAEDTAARLGAQVISNSYGARESGFTQAQAPAYVHPGHTIVASTGDTGYSAAAFPANLAGVTAAGGTELAKAANSRGWTEKVWNTPEGASGSGCSAYVTKPAWQHDTHCPGRTMGDVAALAWNVPIYDSSISKAQGGPWLTVGGTSAASPLIAGVYGLAGNASTIQPGYVYAHARSLFDVTTGNNDYWTGTHGGACGYDYLCVAKPGYDAPTGLGTPDGIGGF